MEIRAYLKQEIALKQIETALEIFFAKGDLFSVITLAAAAEEILAQLPVAAGASPVLKAFTSIFQILRLRPNPEGERHPALEDEELVHMDPYHEATFLLGRAIDEYQRLSGVLTPAMLRFNTSKRGGS